MSARRRLQRRCGSRVSSLEESAERRRPRSTRTRRRVAQPHPAADERDRPTQRPPRRASSCGQRAGGGRRGVTPAWLRRPPAVPTGSASARGGGRARRRRRRRASAGGRRSRSCGVEEGLRRIERRQPGDAPPGAGVGGGLGDQPPGDAGEVLRALARRVDAGHDDEVGGASAAPNSRAWACVRENRCGWKTATTRPRLERAGGGDRRRDLGRVVGVVVDDERAGRRGAEALEAPRRAPVKSRSAAAARAGRRPPAGRRSARRRR